MLVSEIADIFYKITPLRIKKILHLLGQKRAQSVKRLIAFEDNVAGGIMKTAYYWIGSEKTVKETLQDLSQKGTKPESIVVVGENNKLFGTLLTKNLINTDPLAILKDIISDKKFVYANTNFSQLLRLFTMYNLRLLPVVDEDKRVIGVISIDAVLSKIEEDEEKNDVFEK